MLMPLSNNAPYVNKQNMNTYIILAYCNRCPFLREHGRTFLWTS
uniref:Uncharacterized protein n=1 Tax=Arundo donax TaxID=35708 RepID=A0A0A8Y5N9_ARUDO